MSEYTVFLAVTALCCLPLIFALAASGLPALTAGLLVRPPKRLKVFRDKFGQQATTFALLSGVFTLTALAGGGFFLKTYLPDVALFWLSWPLPGALLAGTVGGASVFLVIYRASWHALVSVRVAHALLGCMASLCGWAFACVVLAALRHFILSPTLPTLDTAFFLPEQTSLVWYYLPLCLLMSLGASGAMGGAYLVYRRDKDDFGRDYYNYSMKLVSRWSLIGTLLALIVQAGACYRLWPLVRDLPLRSTFFWCEGVSGAAAVLACLLWVLVLRNKNPLRMKFHLVSAAILLWVSLSGQLGGFARFYFN